MKKPNKKTALIPANIAALLPGPRRKRRRRRA